MSHEESTEARETIAIVGMSGRFPGARDLEEYWRNLAAGVESIRDFSDEEMLAAGVAPELLRHPNYVRRGADVADADKFDADFFDINPREAEITDPGHRVFLECAWAALENAGYDPRRYDGWIGVFAGSTLSGYLLKRVWQKQSIVDLMGILQVVISNDRDFVPTRVSYKLNLNGPSFSVQSACSTSLLATHLACQSLLNYECDMALAGGVCIYTPQTEGYLWRDGSFDSPDGHCRSFDAKARGTVFSNGVGITVLKRLSDALEDGDRIHAVIRGSAVNNDGADKVGFTAPGVEGQVKAIAMAQEVAGVHPDEVGYIEAHGTATTIGDPIEVSALTRVFRAHTERKQYCGIGSVKTNIGHADAAAGVAGLLKTTLALEHELLPPSLNYEKPNPKIDFDSSPFFVVTEPTPWRRGERPRVAGVSSFGIGGTNAHVILEEAPEVEPSGPSRPWQLLPLSAKTPTALDAAGDNLAAHLRRREEDGGMAPEALADTAHTLQVGRQSFLHRRFLVAESASEAARILEEKDPKRLFTRSHEGVERPVAFLFSGQGSQYVGMGRDLYQREEVFRREVDRCAEILEPHLGLDLRAVIYPEAADDEAAERLQQTAMTQPALFVVEYALARLWMSWGVRPAAMIGHSIGEYVAACLAGVFTLEDALALVARRGRLMQSLPAGAMMAVSMDEEELPPLLGEEVSLAAINAPGRLVVAGREEAVAELEAELRERKVSHRRLHTSHAFHSPMMEPILEEFRAEVAKVERRAPELPCVSNRTGTWATAEQLTDPAYWADHLRHAVRFSDGLATLLEDPDRLLLEVGPGRALATLARRQKLAPGQSVFTCLRHPTDEEDDQLTALTALGHLWSSGVEIDWAGFYAEERRLRVPLPTYPFERKRFWLELDEEGEGARAGRGRSLIKQPDVKDWFYLPSWKRTLPPRHGVEVAGTSWLVFTDSHGLGERVVERLRQRGAVVAVVEEAAAGEAFRRLGDGRYALAPQDGPGHDALFQTLEEAGTPPERVLHLWNVTGELEGELDDAAFDASLGRAFYGLLTLAQALGRHPGAASTEAPLNLVVVSDGMQKVAGEEVTRPEKATLLGPCQVINREYTQLRAASVDVDLDRRNGAGLTALADRLIAEAAGALPDAAVAHRGGDRWARSYEAVTVDPVTDGDPGPLRDEGVYLITGGLGGIGLVLAEHLARAARARLVLAGRSPLPPRAEWDAWLAEHDDLDRVSQRLRAVRELEALGAEVLVESADAADAASMRALVERAVARFGAIHGAIHAAGVPGGGVIQLKDPALAGRVLEPKARGMRALARALEDQPLDFLLACSSVAAVLGEFGQVDYCAANSFLDAYTAFLSARRGIAAVSVNWDAWDRVGMAVETSTGHTSGARSAPRELWRAGHPLLDRWGREGEDVMYETSFSPERHWVLSEHWVLGTPAIPGVTYLEMARAACAQQTGAGAVEISDVLFFTPFSIEHGQTRPVQVLLQHVEDASDGDGGYRFAVRGARATPAPDGDEWQEHALGRVRPLGDARPEVETHDLKALLARCDERVEEVTGTLGDEAFVFWGPRWQNLERVHVGSGGAEAVALLELPEEFRGDLEDLHLHPSMLDSATTFVMDVVGEEKYLPLSYGRLRAWGALPERFYCWVRRRPGDSASGETLSFDMTMLDESGRALVEVDNFTMKRVGEDLLAGEEEEAPMSYGVAALEQPPLSAYAIQPEEGVDAFRRVLSVATVPQIVVATRHLGAMMAEAEAQARRVHGTDEEEDFSQGHARPDLSTAYAAPTNPVEERIARLWQSVLGLQQVGIHDNFFELGGDSLLGVQLVARANERGMQLTPQQLFEHPTVADLAALVAPQLGELEGPVSGEVPLLPAGHLFLGAAAAPDAAFERVVVELASPLEAAAAERAVAALVAHHDALRSRFTRGEEGWGHSLAEAEEGTSFHRFDLSPVAAVEHGAAMAAEADRRIAAARLEEGPLFLALLFHGGEAPDRFMLLAHRLVVDRASWPVLLADLATACQQAAGGEKIELPEKTASVKRWARALAEGAAGKRVTSEVEFWARRSAGAVALPFGEAGEGAPDERVVSIELDERETRELTDQAPEAYNTHLDELLTTALARALAQRTGGGALLAMETGGRPADGLAALDLALDFQGDLSRTVGGLTAVHPLPLDLEESGGLGEFIKGVKEQMRAVPRGGLGYGMLRYLRGDEDIARRLAEGPEPQVLYGRCALAPEGPPPPLFAHHGRPDPASRPSWAPGRHALEVRPSLAGGRLRVAWVYDARRADEAFIRELADSFLGHLRELVAHCLSPDAGGFTPSDFPEAGLDQEMLDKVLSRL